MLYQTRIGAERYVLNILIIDDDALHGRSVRDLLAAHNYPAEVQTSGTHGVAELIRADRAGEPYHVVVLDLHIPDLPGLEVMRQIEAAELKCKIIILSGEQDLSSVAPVLNLGAVDYIPKPFQADQLINSISNAISRYALEKENARMQREAEENAELYKFLLNASPDLVYMLDPQGRFQFANAQLSSVFDRNMGELIGQPWQSLFERDTALQDDLEFLINERRTGARATQAAEFEYASDLGTHHTLELSAIGLYENEGEQFGQFLGSYGVIRDITDSKRTRKQLQQSQRKFYSLFVDSPDAVFISELASGAIIERNPQFVALKASVEAGDDDTDHFLWSEHHTRSEFIAALETTPNQLEWNIETELGPKTHFFEIRARRLELEGQICVLATLRDRTAEREAEQDRLAIQRQLQQAGRMEAIGQVAGGIAHDFNNILASIIGYTELVINARSRLDDEQINQYLDEVVTAGHRAKDLISQMLTFTRARRGEARSIDVTQTITDVSRMLRAAIPSSIDLETEFSTDLDPVAIDPIQLQQIIINLLINARDAIDGNGKIEVIAENAPVEGHCAACHKTLDGDYLQISVVDSGHGIKPDIVDKIFEMYFTTRDPDTGTGFGLWMVNNLVHENHGHISVRSEENEGTAFTIHLPRQRDRVVEEAVVNVAKPRIKGRILVVDDEVSVANFIGEVLRDKGYPTVVFTDSPQALDYLENNLDSVALLLTDGSMPLITGTDLAGYAKSHAPELPVIFITAFNHNEQALKEIGVDRFLQKPFSINEMVEAVQELTGATLQEPA